MLAAINSFQTVLVQRGKYRVLFLYCEDGRTNAYYDESDTNDWPLLRVDIEEEHQDGWATIPGCSLVTLKTVHAPSQELIELAGQIIQAIYTFKSKPGLLASHLRTCPFVMKPQLEEIGAGVKEMPGEDIYRKFRDVAEDANIFISDELDEKLADLASEIACTQEESLEI